MRSVARHDLLMQLIGGVHNLGAHRYGHLLDVLYGPSEYRTCTGTIVDPFVVL